MRILELSLRNYRVFEEVELELPARVVGIFGENGSGKCLPGWVRVHDPDKGESLPIEEVVRERRKRVLGLRDGHVLPVEVSDWHELGPKPIVRVTLSSGATLEAASTHPILTDRGPRPAGSLAPGDWVAEARTLPGAGPGSLSVDEALLVGLLLGDGTTTTSVTLSATESSVIDLFRETVERTFPGCTVHPSGGRKNNWIVVSASSPAERRQRIATLAARLDAIGIPLEAYLGPNLSRFWRGEAGLSWETMDAIESEFGIDLFEDRCALHGGRAFLEWARSLGMLGKVAATKRLPKGCLLLPAQQVRALLAGLWLTDGWVLPNECAAAYGSDSFELVRDVRLLLLRLGMRSTITVHRRAERPHYRVNVSAEALRRWDELPLVGPKAARTEQMLATLRQRGTTLGDPMPPTSNRGMAGRAASGRTRSQGQITRHAMSRETFRDFGGDPSIADAETAWAKVVSVDPLAEEAQCYDLTVDTREHLYLAETFVVHNSTLMEAIAFALYGVDAARTKKQQIRTHGVLVDCDVRVVFEHAGQQFDVRRTIKGKGHAPEAQLFGGGLQLAAGTTEVDAEVRRLLHMDLHVFRSSVFAEQKQLDAFSDLTPGKRKEMALRLLGIKPVDDARTDARRQARSTKESAQQLEGAVGDLASLGAELKGAKEAEAEAKELAKAAAAELREAIAEEAAAAKAFARADAARERIEKLAVRLQARTDEHDRLVGRRDELAGRAERLAEELAELPALVEELEGLAGIDDRLRAAARLAEQEAELGAARAQLEALPAVDAEAALAALRASQEVLAARQAAAAEAQAERTHRTGLLEQVRERLARASEADPAQACPTCGRPLGEDFAGYLRHCKAEVVQAKKAAAAAERAAKASATELGRAERAQRAAAEVGESARELGARRSQLEERVAMLGAEVEELAAPFDGAPPHLDALRSGSARASELTRLVAELGGRREHLEQVGRDHATAVAAVEEAERDLAALAEEAEAIEFDGAEHARLRDETARVGERLAEVREAERQASDAAKDAGAREAELTGELRRAKETASRVDELRSDARYVERVGMLLDGFRDHLVARVGPELSREAEALFRELTNHEYDDLRVDEETLSIQVADGDEYFPIDRFSGSETDLANLALRVAISTQLSRMSGADVGMLVLDEVLASLDEERKDLMVQALGQLSARFHQLFVITHAERVKDRFPATILVRKTGRRRSVAELV